MSNRTRITEVKRPALLNGDGIIRLVLKGGDNALIDDTPANREWSLCRNWQLHQGMPSTSYRAPDGTRTSRTLKDFVCPTHYTRPKNGDPLDCRLSNLELLNPRPKPFVIPPMNLRSEPDFEAAYTIAIQEMLMPETTQPTPAPAPVYMDPRDIIQPTPEQKIIIGLRKLHAEYSAQSASLITQIEELQIRLAELRNDYDNAEAKKHGIEQALTVLQ